MTVCLYYVLWMCMDDRLNLNTNEKGSIAIAMAVYNGEPFLVNQIHSIANQTMKNWNLFFRDDGSYDISQDIVSNFCNGNRRAYILSDGDGNLGAGGNFRALIQSREMSGYDYVAFSDQDDVWELDKLSVQLKLMHVMEEKFPTSPLLIHSDMRVVDASLKELSSSFMNYQGIHNENNPVPVLLAQNFVTGCTVLVNRSLLDIALPIPEEALMHDWWLALCAAVFGHIGCIDRPLVKYRQHENNEVGAKHLRDLLNPLSGKWKQRWLEGRVNLYQSMKQAKVLAARVRLYDPKNPYLSLIEEYASLQQYAPLKRVEKINQLGIHCQSKIRQTLLLSRLMFMRKA